MTASSGAKFGPVQVEPGVAGGHMWTLMLASFVSIGLVTGVAAMTPFLLTVNLAIPEDQQGQALGLMALVQEIVLILAYAPLGLMADRVGRRAVMAAGFATLAIGYAAFPFADNLFELSMGRIVYALGIGAITGMLSTIIADYGVSSDRGKLSAICGFLNGLGIVVVTILIGRAPEYFVGQGYSESQAGFWTMGLAAALCLLITLAMIIGLKGGVPEAARAGAKKSFWGGIAEGWSIGARNPRIALSYAAGFVARGDLAIVGLFAIAWGKKAAIEVGMDPAQALKAGLVPFIVAQSAALLWPAVLALPLDRLRRLSAMALCMGLGAVGYGVMGLVADPLAPLGLGLFAILGIGQISAFLGAQSTIAKEAPAESRGAVIGMFNFAGAVGILVLTSVGGLLFDRVGPWAPFVLVAALNGLVALAAIALRLAPSQRAAA